MKFIHQDEDFGALLDVVATDTGIAPALVEKDYWVVHALPPLRVRRPPVRPCPRSPSPNERQNVHQRRLQVSTDLGPAPVRSRQRQSDDSDLTAAAPTVRIRPD